MASSHFWIKFLASSGFLGYSPLVPGTFGSLGGVLIYLILSWSGASLWIWLVTAAALTGAAIWVADKAEKIYAAKDPRKIVIDEVAGMLIALIAVPFDLRTLVIGFILFRVLDILKPFPARTCENFPGGWGIVLDDVVSGLYARGILSLIILLTPSSPIP